MSIKSTRYVTRRQAISLGLGFKAKQKEQKWTAKFEAMTDTELGDALDVLTDSNFENFIVVSDNDVIVPTARFSREEV